MDHIIFVGGIHGVGKTELCRIISQHLHMDHVSASDLIRNAGRMVNNNQKRVDKIAENQDFLLSGLNAYKSCSSALLLDGHFCLIDKQGNIQPIPQTTFDNIAPKAVLVLIDEAETIRERLKIRDGISYSLDLIANFQEYEINHASQVCKNLNIPCLTRKPNTSMDEVLVFIKEQLP